MNSEIGRESFSITCLSLLEDKRTKEKDDEFLKAVMNLDLEGVKKRLDDGLSPNVCVDGVITTFRYDPKWNTTTRYDPKWLPRNAIYVLVKNKKYSESK